MGSSDAPEIACAGRSETIRQLSGGSEFSLNERSTVPGSCTRTCCEYSGVNRGSMSNYARDAGFAAATNDEERSSVGPLPRAAVRCGNVVPKMSPARRGLARPDRSSPFLLTDSWASSLFLYNNGIRRMLSARTRSAHAGRRWMFLHVEWAVGRYAYYCLRID